MPDLAEPDLAELQQLLDNWRAAKVRIAVLAICWLLIVVLLLCTVGVVLVVAQLASQLSEGTL